MTLKAAQLPSGKRTKPQNQVEMFDPDPGTHYCMLLPGEDSMETLEALSKGGKVGGPQLRMCPQQGGGGKWKREGNGAARYNLGLSFLFFFSPW